MTFAHDISDVALKMRTLAQANVKGMKVSAPHTYLDFVDYDIDLANKQISLTFTLQTSYAAVKNFNMSVFANDLQKAINTASPNTLKSIGSFANVSVFAESDKVVIKDLQAQYDEQQKYCADVMHMSECDDDDEYYAEKDIGVCFKHKLIFAVQE